PAGGGYLVWFVRARVLDGNAQPVTEALLAVRQTPDTLRPLSASHLVDLVPAPGTAQVPNWMEALARSPQVVLDWSTEHQQLPMLSEATEHRRRIVALRREPMLADARAALQVASDAYAEAAFGDQEDVGDWERRKEEAERRLADLEALYAREEACSLDGPEVVAIAAVLPAAEGPEHDLPDTTHDIEMAAMRIARRYEEKQGRQATDVSGEDRQFPYDLHSTGPGGVRCIEVKGTTTGRVLLSENEKRTAQRLGPSYYLYIVADPLGAAALSIVRDPLSKMTHDSVLYSGARYVFNASTWRAARDEEVKL
ncbi:MAG: DUF3883 domain-containing protein, partial [Chloroflexi bacterium]|nr:DUF3883 domain-containing protein [Chloroflexota bacterium]